MITLITGVPGSGKTAHVVELLLDELKKQRKIYCVGIPNLIAHHKIEDKTCPDGFRYFAVEQGGNPLTWQRGTWLKLPTYKKVDMKEEEFNEEEEDAATSSWQDNENKNFTKEVLKEVVDKNTGEITTEKVVVDDPYPDRGALVIIDECQTYFRPRSTSAAVPDYIAAFEVHRHVGLDFWILTQRPSLLDGNIRGLVSKHIHIRTTSMGRKKYEWAECQNPESSQARSIASSSSYKPNPRVFELYQSAQAHTKLKIKLPNGIYILGFLFITLCLLVFFLYSSMESHFVTDANANTSVDQVKVLNSSKNETSLNRFPSVSLHTSVESDLHSDVRKFQVVGFVRSSSFNFFTLFDPFSNHTFLVKLVGTDVYQGHKLMMGSFFDFKEDANLVFFPEYKDVASSSRLNF